ncbi:MAG: transcriptional regulator [Epulopiscium sp. Nele67-Bin002]|nr:MAG: transcriptional repressor [Epulopiscium sp. Nele67-Bin001]OON92470.1 MAG: transcriptional regulator [Epulopiscium sp. Nele67-Bin002]
MLATAEILKEKKLKVTPQRLAIFYHLCNTKAHPSAETIYLNMLELHPTMSLATVYKTLDALVKAKLIQQINVGEDVYRYDANTDTHPHIICIDCCVVKDLELSLIPSNTRDKVEEATGFQIISEQLFLYGLCPDCQAKSVVNN